MEQLVPPTSAPAYLAPSVTFAVVTAGRCLLYDSAADMTGECSCSAAAVCPVAMTRPVPHPN